MDWKSLFESLPDFIRLFVPGFVCLKIYGYYNDRDNDSFEVIAVTSVFLSYVLTLLSKFICIWIPMSNEANSLLSIGLGVLFSFIFVGASRWRKMKALNKRIGRVTGSKSIWDDILDDERGSNIRCFTQFNHTEAVIEGAVKYYSVCKDGECQIAIVKYRIKYENGNIYDPNGNEIEPVLYLNTANAHGIEITYGKEGHLSQ